jgi:hypothetical protein
MLTAPTGTVGNHARQMRDDAGTALYGSDAPDAEILL